MLFPYEYKKKLNKLTLFRVTLLMKDILDFFSPFIATWAWMQSREYEQHCLV